MSRHRTNAKRNVRLAQISALGLVALAGLLAAMPAPPDIPLAPPIDPKKDAPAPAAQAQAVDYASILGVFSLARKGEPKKNVDEQKPADDGAVAHVEPPPHVDPWPHFNYVGMAAMRHTYAIIADQDGKTQCLAQGDYVGDYLVLGVCSEKLVLADCNDERRDYMMVARPEVAPHDTLLEAATSPTPPANPAAAKAAEMSGTTIRVPAGMNAVNEQAERDRIQSKMRELEERRNQALKQNGQNPPTRPGPAFTRPTSPQTKPPVTKEKESVK